MCPELRLNGSIIAKFDEGVAECETPAGSVGLKWQLNTVENIRQIVLDCTMAPTLAGENSLVQRKIQLNREGRGSTTLIDAQNLEFSMGRRVAPPKPHKGWRVRGRYFYDY